MAGFHVRHFRLKQVMEQMGFSAVRSMGLKHTHTHKHEPCRIHLPYELRKCPAVTERYNYDKSLSEGCKSK